MGNLCGGAPNSKFDGPARGGKPARKSLTPKKQKKNAKTTPQPVQE